MKIKLAVATAIYQGINESLTVDKVMDLIERPKYEHHGDLSFPCFELAKTLKKAPNLIAKKLSQNITSQEIEKCEAIGAYVNVFLKRAVVGKAVLTQILALANDYGSHKFGMGKTAVLDFSSPNLAKPFSMGHLLQP